MGRMTVLFLLRHGEAVQNVRRILDSAPGDPGFGLTEIGRDQVLRSADIVAAEGVDVMFASPLRRARETAELVAGRCGDMPILFDERIRETDFGSWSGKSADDFWARYPDPLMRIDGNGHEGLEGLRDMRRRLAAFLSDALSEHGGKRIAVVSHGDPLEQLHGILRGWTVERAVAGWYPDKGSVTRIEIAEDTVGRILSGETDPL